MSDENFQRSTLKLLSRKSRDWNPELEFKLLNWNVYLQDCRHHSVNFNQPFLIRRVTALLFDSTKFQISLKSLSDTDLMFFKSRGDDVCTFALENSHLGEDNRDYLFAKTLQLYTS